MIINSKPLYGFISTGDKTAMYTLRIMESCLVGGPDGGSIMNLDYYVKNLSNNKEKAEAVAAEICEDIGVPLKSDASFELNEIKRRKSEMLAAEREAYEKEIQERQEKIEREFDSSVLESVFLSGKYIGKTPAEADLGYLFWLAEQGVSGSKSKYDINVQIAQNYIEQNNIQKPGYVGIVGEQIELELKLISCYTTNGRFLSYVFKSVTPTGEAVVFFSTSKKFLALKDGDTFKITGLVRSQDEYNGQNSTVINKPKMGK